MPYFSNTEHGSCAEDLGCGPECKCGPCKAGLGGLDEWYEKEQQRQPRSQSSRSDQSPPQSRPTQSLSGSDQFALGYRGSRRRLPLGPPSPITLTHGAVSPPWNDQRIVQDALRRGVRNLRQLTAAIFFSRHPSLRAEWVQIRDRIARPALQQSPISNRVFNKRGAVK